MVSMVSPQKTSESKEVQFSLARASDIQMLLFCIKRPIECLTTVACEDFRRDWKNWHTEDGYEKKEPESRDFFHKPHILIRSAKI